jgi:hypothetical protein
MKRFFPLLLCVCSISIAAAQDMAAFFIQIPDSYLPQLEDAWRKDLVDLYQSGKPAVLENTMGGRSTIQKLTPDYLLLQTTERSTMEIRFFPLINNTHIACVITTVYGPAADSRVEFYSTDWQPLPASGLWIPAKADWFIKEDIDRNDESFREAKSSLDMELIYYQLDPDKLILEARLTTPDYLSPEERDKVKPFLKDASSVYDWKAGRFEINPVSSNTFP